MLACLCPALRRIRPIHNLAVCAQTAVCTGGHISRAALSRYFGGLFPYHAASRRSARATMSGSRAITRR